jgi:hypothetical protein
MRLDRTSLFSKKEMSPAGCHAWEYSEFVKDRLARVDLLLDFSVFSATELPGLAYYDIITRE